MCDVRSVMCDKRFIRFIRLIRFIGSIGLNVVSGVSFQYADK